MLEKYICSIIYHETVAKKMNKKCRNKRFYDYCAMFELCSFYNN